MCHQEPISPIIKVVGTSCNLRCAYCFYEGQQSSNLDVMNETVLSAIIDRLYKTDVKAIQFVWHGGEPLLAGIQYYKKIIRLQQKLSTTDKSIRNSIQTNGTLVTKEWANFLAKNDFGVGVSLDGPEHIHNYVRVNASNRGSHKKVMEGVDRLRDAGIHTGAIAVINSYSVRFPQEIFDFFYSHKLPFSINECVAAHSDPQSVKELAVEPFDYARFLIEVFDLWLKTEDPEISVRPITDFVRSVAGKKPRLCNFTGSCHKYLTIDTNGDVYPCEGYRKNEYLLGNLITASFEDISKSANYQNYYARRKNMLHSCGECKWVSICKGWCMRTMEINPSTLDTPRQRYCDALKFIFTTISSRLNSLGYDTI